MNENTRKNAEIKSKTKDRYTAVLVSQIIALIIMLLTFNLAVKNSDKVYADFQSLLKQELFTVSDIIETVKDYFSGNNNARRRFFHNLRGNFYLLVL